MRLIDMPSARITCDSSMQPEKVGAENAGGEQIDEPKPGQAYILQLRQLGLFQPSVISLQQSMGFGENGKRYQLHQPASTALDRACRTYPYNPNILIQHSCPQSDYNNGATLIRAGVVRIHFFL
ncbi:hypothetical protein ACFOLJ_16285 [Rugamonas sp. CCM 8940]|uniref:hypothetical protein n=1 Tax=Rugamonas sp. CCM 8940 TaxID=2765359 RepID=UPI0018F37F9D|nr:hypothetical protein [Rugamonas sp. CCM 8940]MBJ7309139.1 hypothetical protein [Rugamonas sp. CCM 8940]